MRRRLGFRGGGGDGVPLAVRGLWYEIPRGPAILRGVDLVVAAGESIALMGRNGAGKSTLLRHAAGLLAPTRGKVEAAGRVALLLQNPNDYFLHERVAQEVSPRALAAAGLEDLAERNPRDLSGGERQRLALAIVAGDGQRAPAGDKWLPGDMQLAEDRTDEAIRRSYLPWTSPREAWTARPKRRSPPSCAVVPGRGRQ